MADKVITIAGQRIKVTPFSDYYLEPIKELFDGEGKLIFSLKLHSDIIAMTVEVIAPTLPKHFFRKVGESYRWVASFEAFAELLNGLWLSYWEVELESAQKDKAPARIEAAQAQITLYHEVVRQVQAASPPEPIQMMGEPESEPEPERTVEELQAELGTLRAMLDGAVA